MSDADPIRIVVVDDHALLRGTLARTLAAEPDFVIVDECAGVDEALQIVKYKSVDIVLLDVNLGSEQGGAFLKRASALGYRGKVLAVTAGVSEREAAWLVRRGCSGIFLKNEPLPNLVKRIREVVEDASGVDADTARAILARDESGSQGIRKRLTPREKRVLRCVCEGLSNKEIAQQMDTSENGVKSFLQRLFAKTGARSRAGLVAVAIEQYWDQLNQM
jgi:DNA-binding NarL/FixJ family response regulator